MKKFSKLVCLFFVINFFFCACSSSDKNEYKPIIVTTSLSGKDSIIGNKIPSFPLVKDNATLNILSTAYGDINCEDIYVWKKYEEKTNVKINWTTTRKNNREEELFNTLTYKQKCDLIIRCKVDANRLIQYGENNLIINLAKDDLLKNYAPNCWAYLTSHPDTLASIQNPDGSIYALPQVNSGAELRVSRKIFVNKNWLQKFDLELPSTTEEFYKMLKLFKENDANGNGVDDEIPLCSADWLSVQEAFYGAFGLSSRGIHNQIVDYDEKNNEVRFIPTSLAYKEFLEYFIKLYNEKLMDNFIFTTKTSQWLNNINNDKIGAFVSTNLASLPADKMNNWVAIEEALEGPNGDKLWSAIRANFHSTGAGLIPATCSNPQLVLQWLDYFWTDEGTLFYHMGIENDTFTYQNGVYDYSQKIYDEMKNENKSFDEVIAKYSPYPGGSNPTVEIAPYFKGGEMEEIPANASKKLMEYGPKEFWPSFTFTSLENERLTILETDIKKYYKSCESDFIIGKKSINEWDNYVSTITDFGKVELFNIYKSAIQRYNSIKNN